MVWTVASGDTSELGIARLAERLAIIDDINDDTAHELAIAAIQLAVMQRRDPAAAGTAVDLALIACHRSLEGMRRVRRKLGGAPEPAPIAAELEQLEALAAECSAALRVTPALPAPQDLTVGLLLTALRVAAALLRACAHTHAQLELTCDEQRLRVRVESALAPAGWRRPIAELAQVRERVAWFDGHVIVEPVDRGSRLTVELPL